MKVIVKAYGRFCVAAMILIGMITLCLLQGYLEFMGTKMPVEEKAYHAYSDFREGYYEECQKEAPVIAYVKGSLRTGSHTLSELVEAYDYADRKLIVKVHSILDPKNEEVQLNEEEEIGVEFAMPGVYTVKVSAVDDGNRCSICTIQVPVNAGKEEL